MDPLQRQKQRKTVYKFAAAATVAWGLYWLVEPLLFADYDAVELAQPADLNSMRPVDINDKGDVLGEFERQITQERYASGTFIVRNGKFEEINIAKEEWAPGWRFSVSAINNSGVVVGTWKSSSLRGPTMTRALSYASDSKKMSFFPWSADHYAIDINDAGHVVAFGTGKKPCKVFAEGYSGPGPTPEVDGFCETPSLIIGRAGVIETRIGADYLRPTAINALGQVSFFKNDHYKENAINSSGTVTGQWLFRDRFLAFANKQDGAMLNIPTDMHESSGLSINDAGVVIGRRHNTSIVPFLPVPLHTGDYFVYKDGKVRNLRIASGIGRFKYRDIDFIKINNRGQILAQVRNGNRTSAFVLTPKS